MSRVQFPSGTNQSLFAEYMDSNFDQDDYTDEGDKGIVLKRHVLDNNQSAVDFAFSVGGVIEDYIGH